MWAYAVWVSDRDDWHRTADGVVWMTGSMTEAIAKSKSLRKATVLNFYAEAAS